MHKSEGAAEDFSAAFFFLQTKEFDGWYNFDNELLCYLDRSNILFYGLWTLGQSNQWFNAQRGVLATTNLYVDCGEDIFFV